MFATNKLNKVESTRVVIIGAGSVGATSAFALLIQGIASEIVLIDRDAKKAEGEVMDLEHGASFAPHARMWAGDYVDCKDADVVVITAGAKQKPGQSRLELVEINTKITQEIVKNIRRYTKQAVILMVANPLDITTYVATKTAGFAWGQVFGTGTTLDSSRFRYLLAQKMNVDPESVGAYLLGEHGDSSVPVYSHANVMGEPVSLSKKELRECSDVAKRAAYEVIDRKGATYYAIAMAVARIVRAILYDENHVFVASVLLRGEYGISDVCLSVPVVVGRSGVKKIIPVTLSAEEKKQLQKSAEVMKQNIKN
ncbi:L-lactate dehydrogenase [Candidatus Falkowbacteria bacterium RIFOXYC2_FULL_47_12]|uniref:L-lactate dehydrogenase n=2 Tax=Candidatus Falkowiibacteriota TaxID=1752728 RepID=A0A1F5TPZ7_9BACT|nr:MAG: L-lactate dehydrogenase [Candidatus Falkowbacteria bacterium RIFOXYA2_FULL_47_9]OGF40966.1 MAG: L-lactate dehydrogenase [Candidatus Falkowbacteria bacterium RIFOXYC2_FULL_47_12]